MKDYVFSIRIEKTNLDKIRENAQKANMTTTAYLINRALKDDNIEELNTNNNERILLLHKAGRSDVEIAKELGLNNSTVSRHIAAATRKLRNIASYYM